MLHGSSHFVYTFPTVDRGVFLWDFKGTDESLPRVNTPVPLLDRDPVRHDLKSVIITECVRCHAIKYKLY